MRDLIAHGRSQPLARLEEGFGDPAEPFLALHREMNSLFEDDFGGFGLRDFTSGLGWPQFEVIESDHEVRVTAELPGLDAKDINVRIEDGVLSVRGESHSEFDHSDRSHSERHYRRFNRTIPLPAEIDDERADATFKAGVLTIVLPKARAACERGGRRAIKRLRLPFSSKKGAKDHAIQS